MKAFGLDNAKKLLKHWPYVYCPTLGVLFVKNANPKVGDVVIFKHGDTFTHTGFVTKVAGDRFWTIEGNTSGASGIVANGGGCARRAITTVIFRGQNFVHRTIQLFYLQIKMKQTRQQTQKEAATCLTQRQ